MFLLHGVTALLCFWTIGSICRPCGTLSKNVLIFDIPNKVKKESHYHFLEKAGRTTKNMFRTTNKPMLTLTISSFLKTTPKTLLNCSNEQVLSCLTGMYFWRWFFGQKMIYILKSGWEILCGLRFWVIFSHGLVLFHILLTIYSSWVVYVGLAQCSASTTLWSFDIFFFFSLFIAFADNNKKEKKLYHQRSDV